MPPKKLRKVTKKSWLGTKAEKNVGTAESPLLATEPEASAIEEALKENYTKNTSASANAILSPQDHLSSESTDPVTVVHPSTRKKSNLCKNNASKTNSVSIKKISMKEKNEPVIDENTNQSNIFLQRKFHSIHSDTGIGNESGPLTPAKTIPKCKIEETKVPLGIPTESSLRDDSKKTSNDSDISGLKDGKYQVMSKKDTGLPRSYKAYTKGNVSRPTLSLSTQGGSTKRNINPLNEKRLGGQNGSQAKKKSIEQKFSQISGISFVICMKKSGNEDIHAAMYNCTLCHQNTHRLSLDDLMVHCQTRTHMSRVLELENLEYFKNLPGAGKSSKALKAALKTLQIDLEVEKVNYALPTNFLKVYGSLIQKINEKKRQNVIMHNKAVESQESSLSSATSSKEPSKALELSSPKKVSGTKALSMSTLKGTNPKLENLINSKYKSALNELVKLQKNRQPTKIIFLTDSRNVISRHFESEQIKICRRNDFDLDHAYDVLKQDEDFGKGVIYVILCGILSYVTKEIFPPCEDKQCIEPVYILKFKNTCISLIQKALLLHKKILSNTANDCVIFCDLVPVSVEQHNKLSLSNRSCMNNHEAPLNVINFSKKQYNLALYNAFVHVHSLAMGYSPWILNKREKNLPFPYVLDNGYTLSPELEEFRNKLIHSYAIELLNKIQVDAKEAVSAELNIDLKSEDGKNSSDFSDKHSPTKGLSSKQRITKKEIIQVKIIRKYSKIAVIANQIYMNLLKQFEGPKVYIMAEEELSTENLPKYLKKKKDLMPRDTMWIYVTGINCLFAETKLKDCIDLNCVDPLASLELIQEISDKNNIDQTMQGIGNGLFNVTKIAQNGLHPDSGFMIFPPIPLSLLDGSAVDHDDLHKFLQYMYTFIVPCDDITNLNEMFIKLNKTFCQVMMKSLLDLDIPHKDFEGLEENQIDTTKNLHKTLPFDPHFFKNWMKIFKEMTVFILEKVISPPTKDPMYIKEKTGEEGKNMPGTEEVLRRSRTEIIDSVNKEINSPLKENLDFASHLDKHGNKTEREIKKPDTDINNATSAHEENSTLQNICDDSEKFNRTVSFSPKVPDINLADQIKGSTLPKTKSTLLESTSKNLPMHKKSQTELLTLEMKDLTKEESEMDVISKEITEENSSKPKQPLEKNSQDNSVDMKVPKQSNLSKLYGEFSSPLSEVLLEEISSDGSVIMQNSSDALLEEISTDGSVNLQNPTETHLEEISSDGSVNLQNPMDTLLEEISSDGSVGFLSSKVEPLAGALLEEISSDGSTDFQSFETESLSLDRSSLRAKEFEANDCSKEKNEYLISSPLKDMTSSISVNPASPRVKEQALSGLSKVNYSGIKEEPNSSLADIPSQAKGVLLNNQKNTLDETKQSLDLPLVHKIDEMQSDITFESMKEILANLNDEQHILTEEEQLLTEELEHEIMDSGEVEEEDMEEEDEDGLEEEASAEREPQILTAMKLETSKAAKPLITKEAEGNIAMKTKAEIAIEGKDEITIDAEITTEDKDDIIMEAKSTAEFEAKIIAESEAEKTVEIEAEIAEEVEAKIAMESEVKIAVEAKAKIAAETGAKIIAEAEAENAMETKAKIAAETKVKIAAETKAEIAVETKAEIVAETKAGIVVVTEAEIAADADVEIAAKTETDIAAEAEAEIAAEMDTEITAEAEIVVESEVEIATGSDDFQSFEIESLSIDGSSHRAKEFETNNCSKEKNECLISGPLKDITSSISVNQASLCVKEQALSGLSKVNYSATQEEPNSSLAEIPSQAKSNGNSRSSQLNPSDKKSLQVTHNPAKVELLCTGAQDVEPATVQPHDNGLLLTNQKNTLDETKQSLDLPLVHKIDEMQSDITFESMKGILANLNDEQNILTEEEQLLTEELEHEIMDSGEVEEEDMEEEDEDGLEEEASAEREPQILTAMKLETSKAAKPLIITEAEGNIAMKTKAEIAIEGKDEITIDAEITTEDKDDITMEAKSTAEFEAKIIAESEAEKTVEIEAEIAEEVEAKIAMESEVKITVETKAKIAGETDDKIIAEAEAEIAAEAEAKKTMEAESENAVETKAKISAKTKSKLAAETKSKIAAETKAEIAAEAEAEIAAEAEAEIAAEVEAEIVAEAEAEIAVKAEAEIAAAAEAKPEVAVDAQVGITAETETEVAFEFIADSETEKDVTKVNKEFGIEKEQVVLVDPCSQISPENIKDVAPTLMRSRELSESSNPQMTSVCSINSSYTESDEAAVGHLFDDKEASKSILFSEKEIPPFSEDLSASPLSQQQNDTRCETESSSLFASITNNNFSSLTQNNECNKNTSVISSSGCSAKITENISLGLKDVSDKKQELNEIHPLNQSLLTSESLSEVKPLSSDMYTNKKPIFTGDPPSNDNIALSQMDLLDGKDDLESVSMDTEQMANICQDSSNKEKELYLTSCNENEKSISQFRDACTVSLSNSTIPSLSNKVIKEEFTPDNTLPLKFSEQFLGDLHGGSKSIETAECTKQPKIISAFSDIAIEGKVLDKVVSEKGIVNPELIIKKDPNSSFVKSSQIEMTSHHDSSLKTLLKNEQIQNDKKATFVYKEVSQNTSGMFESNHHCANSSSILAQKASFESIEMSSWESKYNPSKLICEVDNSKIMKDQENKAAKITEGDVSQDINCKELEMSTNVSHDGDAILYPKDESKFSDISHLQGDYESSSKKEIPMSISEAQEKASIYRPISHREKEVLQKTDRLIVNVKVEPILLSDVEKEEFYDIPISEHIKGDDILLQNKESIKKEVGILSTETSISSVEQMKNDVTLNDCSLSSNISSINDPKTSPSGQHTLPSISKEYPSHKADVEDLQEGKMASHLSLMDNEETKKKENVEESDKYNFSEQNKSVIILKKESQTKSPINEVKPNKGQEPGSLVEIEKCNKEVGKSSTSSNINKLQKDTTEEKKAMAAVPNDECANISTIIKGCDSVRVNELTNKEINTKMEEKVLVSKVKVDVKCEISDSEESDEEKLEKISSQESDESAIGEDLHPVETNASSINIISKLQHILKQLEAKGKLDYNHIYIFGRHDPVINEFGELFDYTFFKFDHSSWTSVTVGEILQKMGSPKPKSICILMFELSFITKILETNQDCSRYNCSKTLNRSVLKNYPNEILYETTQFITELVDNLIGYLGELSKHLPVLVMPLEPKKVYTDYCSSIDIHKRNHTLPSDEAVVVYGHTYKWILALGHLVKEWNRLLEKNQDYFPPWDLAKYTANQGNIFPINKYDASFLTNWHEINKWKEGIMDILLTLNTEKLKDILESKESLPSLSASCVGNVDGEIAMQEESKITSQENTDDSIQPSVTTSKPADTSTNKEAPSAYKATITNISDCIPTDFFEEIVVLFEDGAKISKVEDGVMINFNEFESLVNLKKEICGRLIAESTLTVKVTQADLPRSQYRLIKKLRYVEDIIPDPIRSVESKEEETTSEWDPQRIENMTAKALHKEETSNSASSVEEKKKGKTVDSVYSKWEPQIIRNMTVKALKILNLTSFKTVVCPQNCIEPRKCLYYHSRADYRRNPLAISYGPSMCNFAKKGCRNRDCSYSHNKFEVLLYPSHLYTAPCPGSHSRPKCFRGNPLCPKAHKDSPEMLFSNGWVDLLLFNLSSTFYFLAGTLRRFCPHDLRVRGAQVLLIGPSMHYLHVLSQAMQKICWIHHLNSAALTPALLESESAHLILATPAHVAGWAHPLFNDCYTVIIVHKVDAIMADDQQRADFCMLWERCKMSNLPLSMIQKVFVADVYNPDLMRDIATTLNIALKEVKNPELPPMFASEVPTVAVPFVDLNATPMAIVKPGTKVHQKKPMVSWFKLSPTDDGSGAESGSSSGKSSVEDNNGNWKRAPSSRSTKSRSQKEENAPPKAVKHTRWSAKEPSPTPISRKKYDSRSPSSDRSHTWSPYSCKKKSPGNQSSSKSKKSLDLQTSSKVKKFLDTESSLMLKVKRLRDSHLSSTAKMKRTTTRDSRSPLPSKKKARESPLSPYSSRRRRSRDRQSPYSSRWSRDSPTPFASKKKRPRDSHSPCPSRRRRMSSDSQSPFTLRRKRSRHSRSPLISRRKRSHDSQSPFISKRKRSRDSRSPFTSRRKRSRSTRSRSDESRHNRLHSPKSKKGRVFKHASEERPRAGLEPSDSLHWNSIMAQMHGETTYDQSALEEECFDREALCAELGATHYREFIQEKSELNIKFEEEFKVYWSMPDMYSDFENVYQSFTNMYRQKYTNYSDEHEQRFWNAFWQSKFNFIRGCEWKKRVQNLVQEFRAKYLSKRSPPWNLPSPQSRSGKINSERRDAREGTSLDSSQGSRSRRLDEEARRDEESVIKETLVLLSSLAPRMGALGNSVLAVIQKALSLGATSPEALQPFGEPDTILLFDLAVKKLEPQHRSLVKGVLNNLVDRAKTAIPKTINLEAIAQATVGKDSVYTLNMIRAAAAIERIDASESLINEYYMRICELHFKMALQKEQDRV